MLEKFWNWVDSRAAVRRIVLGVTLYLTWHSYLWAAAYAMSSDRPGMEVATIIAAVLAPISVLQGHVFKAYLGSRT